MHIECPKHIKFCLPISWMTKITEDDGTSRHVMSSRYENVTIIDQPNYLVCCGAIKGQGEENQKGHMKGCYKAAVMSAKARIASRPRPVQQAPHVKAARKIYLVKVKKTICPLIVNEMMEGMGPTGQLKLFAAIPTECKSWSVAVGHKRAKPGQCEPGETCGRNCKQLPCIAIRLQKDEELAAREEYAHGVSVETSH